MTMSDAAAAIVRAGSANVFAWKGETLEEYWWCTNKSIEWPDGEGMDHKQGNVIARNFPFRGAKTQIWDGGTRVAGFVHSPLLPKAVQGTVSHELFHVTDWAPTILALTKAGKGSHQPFDGYDIWPSLSQASPSPRTEVLYNVNPIASCQAGWPKAGLRVGPYKVLSWGYTIAGIGGGNQGC